MFLNVFGTGFVQVIVSGRTQMTRTTGCLHRKRGSSVGGRRVASGKGSSSDDETEAGGEDADITGDTKSGKYNEKSRQDTDDDDCPSTKKQKSEEMYPTTRLPIPGCLLAMFPDDVDPQDEDSLLHGGRVRSFKHERGNWATYVYFRSAFGVILTPQEELHLSLSQTVVLKHHWILPFTQSLKAGLARCKRFVCSASRLKIYCNAEKTRTFLGMEVLNGHAHLLDLIRVVDETMTEFHLDTFYQDPSFHVSLAWCVGDFTVQLRKRLQELQNVVDNHEEGPYYLCLDCTELRCRTGNKTFRFSLDTKQYQGPPNK
ncbi:U6 snRNA phosphodiesterase 1 isoform X2 [Entelurus aequoreus]|uniref:U6 snRNA phosphodiesterase 1 isoform X2 n=1 Tax=Entelurus aequoreus TaxID=161455 RepID=UPI002B1E0F05|nr:U6 snRNA phosphodiesterase 1 isoform X2 [Entelurus aequoreus]